MRNTFALSESHFAPEPFLVELVDGRTGYVILIYLHTPQLALIKMNGGARALEWSFFDKIKPVHNQLPRIADPSTGACLGAPVQELC